MLADLVYEKGRLTSIRLRPVVLNEKGFDPARFNETRGVPRAAAGGDARRVLEHFISQSKEYSTSFRIEGDVGIVALPPPTTP